MGDNRRVMAGIAVFLLVVLVATVATGTVMVGEDGLVIDGSVFGEETSGGTVHVPAGKVAAAQENGSVTIGDSEKDICVGDCPDVTGGGE